jgi:hypothetical protein
VSLLGNLWDISLLRSCHSTFLRRFLSFPPTAMDATSSILVLEQFVEETHKIYVRHRTDGLQLTERPIPGNTCVLWSNFCSKLWRSSFRSRILCTSLCHRDLHTLSAPDCGQDVSAGSELDPVSRRNSADDTVYHDCCGICPNSFDPGCAPRIYDGNFSSFAQARWVEFCVRSNICT